MAGFSELLQILISCSVDMLGNGAVHGGKGMLLAGAQKIGWANGGSGSRQGKRFAGHSLARRSLGSGFGGCGRGGTYSPKQEYLSRTRDQYRSAMRSGSGAIKGKSSNGLPQHLHGRPGFETPDGPLGRYGSRWCKNGSQQARSYNTRPRGNIKF